MLIVEFLALAALVFYLPIPIVMVLIHSTTQFWRRLGVKSYLCFAILFLSLDALILYEVYRYKNLILAYSFSHPLFKILGFVILGLGIFVGFKSIRKLSIATLWGVPQILPQKKKSKLETRGIYSRVRHPRYLEFILEFVGIAILSGVYLNLILIAYFVPAILLLILLEEIELERRIGASFKAYKKKTPMLIPKI